MARVPSKKVLVHMYVNLVLSRRYEEKLIQLFQEGGIPGWIHSGYGQEATGVALGECLEKTDYLVPYFRSRSSLFAKGLSPMSLSAEIFGRTTGCCAGLSGEGHVASADLGILGAGGVIGSPMPISLGLAYAAKLRGEGQVIACSFGDGASSRGAFHEALNMAAVLALPIVFVCENNGFAEFSTQAEQMKISNISNRAAGYGIPGTTVDGNDPVAVYLVVREAVDRARKGQQPSLIEARTFRMRGHYEGDPGKYRSEEEIEAWRKKDPLQTYQQRLLDEKIIDNKKVAAVEKRVHSLIDEAISFAMESPEPHPRDIISLVYA